jgi:hypothetical protein
LIERRFDWSHNVQAHEALYAGLCEAGARH